MTHAVGTYSCPSDPKHTHFIFNNGKSHCISETGEILATWKTKALDLKKVAMVEEDERINNLARIRRTMVDLIKILFKIEGPKSEIPKGENQFHFYSLINAEMIKLKEINNSHIAPLIGGNDELEEIFIRIAALALQGIKKFS